MKVLRRSILLLLFVGIAGYVGTIVDHAARGQDTEAEALAWLLYEQGADPTTCAAKLERHFELSAQQTAEILNAVYYIDVRPCAEALTAVYGVNWADATQICSVCPSPPDEDDKDWSNTYWDEPRTDYSRPRWMGALDDEGFCDEAAGTCEAGNVGARCEYDDDCDLRISHLSIPGTHESMARCESGGGPSIQCNDLLIDQQLQAGIRAFDIRVWCHEGQMDVTHGCYRQSWDCVNYIHNHYNFDDAMCPIVEFLGDNPSETVLMRVKSAGCKVVPCSDATFVKVFKDYVEGVGGWCGLDGSVEPADYFWKRDPSEPRDAYCLTRPHLSCEADADCPCEEGVDCGINRCVDRPPRLSEVRGKVVILAEGFDSSGWGLVFPCSGEEFCAGGSPFWSIQDDFRVYADTHSVSEKREFIRGHLDRAADYACRPPACSSEECAEACAWIDRDRNWMFLNHTSGTAEGAIPYPEDVARSILIGGSWWEGTLETTYEWIQHYENDYPTIERTGLIMMDYPGPAIIDAIVARNPPGVSRSDERALPISCWDVKHYEGHCGIGPELLPVMALLWWMHRRTLKREIEEGAAGTRATASGA